MSVKLTFLGHAGFLFESDAANVVIDPFLTGNPLAKHKPEQIKAEHLVLTHGHADHVGDSLEIAKANDATIYSAFEIYEYFAEKGHSKCEPANPGGKVTTEFGYVAFTQAFHSSSYEGRYMGMPCGAVINLSGVTIYHAGDTGLFSDLKLIGELYKPDIALLPVGDRFTMGPEHAKLAAEWIQPKVAIPMHYATFGLLTSDISAFEPTGVEVRVLEPGEAWSYG